MGALDTSELTVEGLVPVGQSVVALLLEAGYLFMEMQKFKEAEEVFGGVAALVPHSEVPLICLGNLHFSQGRYERALKFHKDAVSRQPQSALAHAHIGEALLFLKKPEEARTSLQRAIKLEADGDASAFAKSLLEALDAGVIKHA